ncbi:MAG: MotA/TolQ/ExbB proton channel family protein [Sporocytophaga sp.]|uniref:MotA/TolQ/ExbB proton channel family protein n=1 Tax=Sporocytophaga sp. TaxID=2231183 RepID=UPI001B2838B0|nr:MotA/TolQ/ExbB proton channel family protein [Sporocytophaga sp.]MBO9703206.1 MotA/TolQ/ExbB proton channel family protein [Sporocytophaga sp.]
MENQTSSTGKFNSWFAVVAIVLAILFSFILYYNVLGDPSNFQGDNIANHPKEGNYLGVVYKGGLIVPILMSFLLMVLVFSVERIITIAKASGSGSVNSFIRRVKSLLSSNDIRAAIEECDKQKGSVGNVVKSVLYKYEGLSKEAGLNKEQKLVAIQKELEEATSLELPMLEKNLTIIATLASVATLTGLLGTVIGMIKAFAALATAGSPDAVALANGISEALINTALGIATSALAIIAYNFFTSKIDDLTYNIDEIGFSITQSFSASTK